MKILRFNVFVSVFSLGILSSFYLAIVIPLHFIYADVDTNTRLMALIISAAIAFFFLPLTRKFTLRFLDEKRNDFQEGGSLEENSLRD
jgi:hypothetical protein